MNDNSGDEEVDENEYDDDGDDGVLWTSETPMLSLGFGNHSSSIFDNEESTIINSEKNKNQSI